MYKTIPKISLIVCDMAGTVINEGGIVYKTLAKTLRNNNVHVSDNCIQRCYGLQKKEAINMMVDEYIIEGQQFKETIKKKCYREFENNLYDSYFGSESNIKLIDQNIPIFFNSLRSNGIKIALNTGYNIKIQNKIIQKLHIQDFIDDYISSEEVSFGRPYPYMIYDLMHRNNILNIKEVIKIGDTKNDILEGLNAGCTFNIGVLSGAGTEKDLKDAHQIIEKVTHLDIDNL